LSAWVVDDFSAVVEGPFLVAGAARLIAITIVAAAATRIMQQA